MNSRIKGFIDKLAHYVIGALSAVSAMVNPVLPVVCFLAFLSYEMNQQFRKDDWFDEEMREYTTGLAIAIILMLITIAFQR